MNIFGIYISREKIAITFNRHPDLSHDKNKNDQHSKFILFGFVVVLSVAAWLFYYYNGLSLSYNDARAHLNVSRRVFDSLQPGLSQLGSVWLPLQHVLQLATIWNDTMYHTGLSGSLVSILSFIGSAIFLYKISRLIGLDSWSSSIVTILFATNQNMLFMQSTPMTESLYIFTFLASIYFFTLWVKSSNFLDIIFCGLFTCLATLTRYDGWFLLGSVTIALIYLSLMKQGIKRTEGHTILYFIVASLGILLWCTWNKIIFGDWLFFINGPFSAKAQQDILFQSGRLLTRGNLLFSTITYFYSMVFNVGIAPLILGCAGLLYLFFSKINPQIKVVLLLFGTPIVFNILSLFFGQSVIHLPNIPPYTWFNVRYGLLSLPFVAICVGFLTNKKRIAVLFTLVILVVNSYTIFKTNNIITVQDGVRGSSGYYLDDIGKWVHNNAIDGLILVAASSHDALIFASGLQSKQYITEGMEKYWKASLVHPTWYAKYVIMHPGDLVYKKLYNNRNFIQNYQMVYQGKFSDVYKRNF